MLLGLIIGFFIGSISSAVYIIWYIDQMKKSKLKVVSTKKVKDNG